MGRQDEVLKERLRKIDELRKQGINPYPHIFEKKDSALALQKEHEKLKPEQKSKVSAKIAGRLVSFRDLGKIAFGVLQDESGKIQCVIQEDTPEKVSTFFKKYLDIGDFVGVEGSIFRTKRGELSVVVKKAELLSKSLQTLPDKWHGLEDKEERYRKRYLDLVMSPEVKQVFDKREKIIDAIREFLKEKGFHEVDTPYLQTVYGGASARPFTTHLNALDIDLYLAISPELYLKRLIVGGYEKVFTIARNFRNEGIDRWHNPEFTMMEIYQAYADYNDMMELMEDLYVYAAKKVNGSTKVNFKGKEIDFKKPWKRLTMSQAIKKYANIGVEKMSAKELFEIIEENKIEKKGNTWGWAVQSIFEHYCEKHLEEPTFIIDHPLETTPLCKAHRNDKLCRLIERFEPFCMGAELGNAYSELNDPVIQKKLLEEQQSMLKDGNQEANPYDEDFVTALEVGMPPTGGLGVGIDRMIMLLTGQESIRDVLFFPFMKPESKMHQEVRKEERNSSGKAQESQSAVAVVNTGADLLPWQQMNTIAHLTAALGAHKGKQLLFQEHISTKDGEKIALNIQHAIMIKQTSSNKELLALAKSAREEGLEVTEFTREMIETTDDRKVIEQTANKSLKDIEFLGVLIFGKRINVEKLSSSFPLFESFSSTTSKKEKKGGK